MALFGITPDRTGAKPKGLINKARASFQECIEGLGETYQDVISDPNAFSMFPGQDIVDTGDLKRSQKVTRTGFAQYKFTWDVPYSNYVRFGYTTRNGHVQVGRDWIAKGNRRYAFPSKFIKKFIGKF